MHVCRYESKGLKLALMQFETTWAVKHSLHLIRKGHRGPKHRVSSSPAEERKVPDFYDWMIMVMTSHTPACIHDGKVVLVVVQTGACDKGGKPKRH